MKEEKNVTFLDKGQIMQQLNAIVREMTCMSDTTIAKHISEHNFEIKFDHFSWIEPCKIRIKINVEKIPVDTGSNEKAEK